MALSALTVSRAKAQTVPYKLADEGGLYLLVQPSGRRYWRWDYRFAGKRRTLALGVYPDIGLADARVARDRARSLWARGLDPMDVRRAAALEAQNERANTFRSIAEEWLHKRELEGLSAVTLSKARWLLTFADPLIGNRPIGDIRSVELLAVLRKAGERNRHESARRLRSVCGRIFRYAVATGRAEHDLAANLRDALIVPQVRHFAAITDEQEVGPLLRAIEGYQGYAATAFALRLAPHVFVRPGELRQAAWTEIDFGRALWTIPAARMKMRRPHLVPLSRQSIAILWETQAVTGQHRLVFPGFGNARRPMSENTLNSALRRLGYSGNEMTSHGFRSMASTLLNEMGLWNPDAIERQLAHVEADSVRRAYARGAYWDERVRMMQAWSDYLDRLRSTTADDTASTHRV